MFGSYFNLGLEHILDINGIDHVLFLIALALPYALKQWKSVLILATAFTIGHSLTLALSALDIIKVNSTLIEIGIAVSIFLTALLNIVSPSVEAKRVSWTRYVGAAVFGLIHGMGFSNFFKTILGKDDITIPLLAFNIGVEVAQVLVVAAVLLISYVVVKVVEKRWWNFTVSIVIAVWAGKMILERV